MKKTLLLVTAVIMIMLSSAQSLWAKCETVLNIPTTLCVGEKYDLSITDDPCDCIKFDAVEWIITDPVGGTTFTMGSPYTYLFSMAGSYKVCVKWHDGCTGEDHYDCREVVVKDCCETVIDIPATICSGEKYSLSITNKCDCIKPDGVSWIITDPGGAVSITMGSPLSYVFSTPGVYKVCVKWFDFCTGKSHYECKDVVVKDCCKVVFDIPGTICVGEKYNLAIKDDCDCIDYASVKWEIIDPGGSGMGYGGNPLSYVFSMVGTYKVCVYWFNHCTGKNESYCQEVVVKDCCKPKIDIPTTLCAGEKYNLSINDKPCGCIAPDGVKWEIIDPGGAATSYGGTPVSYVFSMVGTYKVCVYWHNYCTGKDESYCQDVVVKDCCPTVIDIPATICSGEKYNLSITSKCDCIKPGGVKWEITAPGGIVTWYAGTPLSYVFSTVGTYKVCVYWHNYCTGKDESYCQEVVVKDCCKPVIDIPTTICAGEKYSLAIKFDCDCINYDEIKWEITDPGGTVTGYSGDPLSYVFSMVGTYKVCVYWYNHCTDKKGSYCQNVEVKDCCKPVIDIPASICVGEKYNMSIKFDCDCINYSDIKWEITDPGGVVTGYSGNPLSYVFTTVGTYKVCVYWYNHCTGKKGSYCQNVVVKDCCPTVIDIPTKLCAGDKYSLSIKNDCGCIKYGLVKWEITEPGGATTGYSGSPLSYVFSTVGTYKVCVYWTNFCTGKDESYCQYVTVKDCCPTVIDIPTSICAGEKYSMSIKNACDCINPDQIKWEITEPGGSTSGYGGTTVSYVFSTVGTYKVCVYWYNHCTGKDESYCQNVVVKNCGCICDMKISKNSSTTEFSGGAIINSFHLNSGSKKVVGVDLSVPYWNYNWEESGCKFNCDELSTGYPLGNIIKYGDINTYYPDHVGCFDEWWAREVDWKFPTPQYIDQDVKFIISIPHTDCKINYTYCVKVLVHYDDCTVCECTVCFRGDEIVCSCEPEGKAAAKMANPGSGLTDDNVMVYPNPNDGTFTVKMQPTSSTKVISVMDMTGKTVMKSVVSGEKADMELNNVAAGTYMVVVTGDGKTVTKRVVISK